MYNGIGLATTRGSGTNGYVQRNLSYVKPAYQREKERQVMMGYAKYEEPHKKTAVNKQILAHERKRQVEVKVMELRDQLEEQGCDDDEIDEKCDALRKQLQARLEKEGDSKDGEKGASSHARAVQKEKQIAKLKEAFGISNKYRDGESFDFDAQEANRLERIENFERQRAAQESGRRKEEERKRIADAPKKQKRRKRSPSSSSSSSSSSDSSDSSDSSSDEDDRRSPSRPEPEHTQVAASPAPQPQPLPTSKPQSSAAKPLAQSRAPSQPLIQHLVQFPLQLAFPVAPEACPQPKAQRLEEVNGNP
ncbi:hypothetical protein ACHHYP_09527 [Achlya hypogyna]|uniref:CWF21 domain-containing protein n=1 Tax=Achlya hypogyna TaxID=1202772 RepID=A0A1V9YN58_ACHHY|nr:hypothetical protein ACHHYP_09527 [Achlya hypogyna]